jgi:hypothetical protein
LPAPHWVVFITDESEEDGELVFEADFTGHIGCRSCLQSEWR